VKACLLGDSANVAEVAGEELDLPVNRCSWSMRRILVKAALSQDSDEVIQRCPTRTQGALVPTRTTTSSKVDREEFADVALANRGETPSPALL
jgi:hypothetical protein